MLHDVLLCLTVDQLKSLMRWLPDTTPVGKKDQLIGQILKSFDGDGLRALWDRLDDTQRKAVAEAAYAERGVFDGKRFRAKYGRLPDFTVDEGGRRYSYRGQPTALGLFLYYEAGRYSLPSDLGERLRGFVQEPPPMRLSPVDALPEKIGEKQLIVRRTELDALVDLPVLLRLADQGKIQTSEKTSLPGSATLRLLTEHLANGDFYRPAGGTPEPEVGPLKAFSWPLLLQAAGLVQRNGSKLALSVAGRKALASAPVVVLSAIWSCSVAS